MKTKTKTEILLETFAFYEGDPTRRAIDGLDCQIQTPDGRNCAYGRCMTNEAREQCGNRGGPLLPHKHSDEYMLPEYQGHGGEFWNDLQCFHDYDDFWYGKNAPKRREEYKQELLKKYNGQ